MMKHPAVHIVSALLATALLALFLAMCAPGILAEPAHAAEAVSLTAAASPAVVVYPGSAFVSGALSNGPAPLPGATLTLLA